MGGKTLNLMMKMKEEERRMGLERKTVEWREKEKWVTEIVEEWMRNQEEGK